MKKLRSILTTMALLITMMQTQAVTVSGNGDINSSLFPVCGSPAPLSSMIRISITNVGEAVETMIEYYNHDFKTVLNRINANSQLWNDTKTFLQKTTRSLKKSLLTREISGKKGNERNYPGSLKAKRYAVLLQRMNDYEQSHNQ